MKLFPSFLLVGLYLVFVPNYSMGGDGTYIEEGFRRTKVLYTDQGKSKEVGLYWLTNQDYPGGTWFYISSKNTLVAYEKLQSSGTNQVTSKQNSVDLVDTLTAYAGNLNAPLANANIKSITLKGSFLVSQRESSYHSGGSPSYSIYLHNEQPDGATINPLKIPKALKVTAITKMPNLGNRCYIRLYVTGAENISYIEVSKSDRLGYKDVYEDCPTINDLAVFSSMFDFFSPPVRVINP